MRFVSLIASLIIGFTTTSCQSNEIPLATPVPDALAPKPQTKRLPYNYPSRPLALPDRAPRLPRCASACVMDALTGKLLYTHNASQKRQVASTQKVLTALVVLDHGSLNDRIVIEPEDTKADPTKLGVRPGESYTKRDLLTALMVRSYNDVAVTLARHTAGSLTRFSYMMNAKARSLGMYNSHFVNPNGLPGDQYSTAIDMARCAYHAYKNPELRHMVDMQHFSFKRSNGRMVSINNTNKLLGKYPWITGMKTGYTNAAGRCLISCGGLNGRHVIVVVLGAKPSQIWAESESLLRWALSAS